MCGAAPGAPPKAEWMQVLSSPDSPSVSELRHLADDHSRFLEPAPGLEREAVSRSSQSTLYRDAKGKCVDSLRKQFLSWYLQYPRKASELCPEYIDDGGPQFCAEPLRGHCWSTPFGAPGVRSTGRPSRRQACEESSFVWSLPSSEHTARDTAGPSHRRAVHLPFRAPCWKPCRPPIRSTTAPKATW